MLQTKSPSYITISGNRKMAYDEVSPPNPKGTILLLTGLGSTRLAWSKQLEAFGMQYRTIALDHRDAGDSFQTTGRYTTADQADDIAAALPELGVSKTHVIGISMGGMMALELTLRYPELVDKLVLVSTTAGGKSSQRPDWGLLMMMMTPPWLRGGFRMERGERALRTYSAIAAPGYFASHPEESATLAENARRLPLGRAAYYRQLMSTGKHDAVSRLPSIKAPTLVIHGEGDRLVPPGNGRFLAQHIPGAKLITYPNTGHIPILERADDFNRDVLAFLND